MNWIRVGNKGNNGDDRNENKTTKSTEKHTQSEMEFGIEKIWADPAMGREIADEIQGLKNDSFCFNFNETERFGICLKIFTRFLNWKGLEGRNNISFYM